MVTVTLEPVEALAACRALARSIIQHHDDALTYQGYGKEHFADACRYIAAIDTRAYLKLWRASRP